eukprot:458295-Pelagomonas_calceolata.AAC.1
MWYTQSTASSCNCASSFVTGPARSITCCTPPCIPPSLTTGPPSCPPCCAPFLLLLLLPPPLTPGSPGSCTANSGASCGCSAPSTQERPSASLTSTSIAPPLPGGHFAGAGWADCGAAEQKRAASWSMDSATLVVAGLDEPSSHSSLGRLANQADGKQGSRYSLPASTHWNKLHECLRCV